jgi:hypothetical protein
MGFRPILVVLLPGLLVSACSWESSGGDAGSEPVPDAAADGASDPADDGGVPGDEGELPDLDPTPLPIGPADVFSIGRPGGFDLGAAPCLSSAGDRAVVWDHFNADFTEARLLEASSSDDSTWSQPADLPLGSADLRANPSMAGSWMYFQEAQGMYGPLTLMRSRMTPSGWGAAQALPAVPGLGSILSWPKYSRLLDGRVVLAFRDDQGRPRIALSLDGASFDAPLQVSDESVAMVAAGEFGNGSLAVSYQTGMGGSMVSWIRISPDEGLSWSEAVRVTESSSNVHDTTLVPRLDGDLDLYFIYPCPAAGFCLFRRAMTPAGELGPEQQVTSPEVGEVSKPAAHRGPDARLLLVWAEITSREPGGAPAEQVLSGALIQGDAPAVD